MVHQPDAEAEIELLPTTDGGREVPMRSGYRSLLRFAEASQDIGVQIDFPSEEIAPGGREAVSLSFWAVEALPGFLEIGARFELREGSRVIGRGVVTSA